ncbi:8183_t:CDS:2, partial [Funneliformis geosporum]
MSGFDSTASPQSVHPNNKIIPHSRCLTSPSSYDIRHFKHSFVIQLKFEGGQGYEQLGNFLDNKNWGSKMRRTGTCAYVLMQNAQQTYNVTFCWKEHVYKDSDIELRCSSMRFEFNIDIRDFVE